MKKKSTGNGNVMEYIIVDTTPAMSVRPQASVKERRVGGRPRLSEKERARRSLVLKLTETDYARLEEYAQNIGSPMATIVKTWIHRMLLKQN